MEKETSKEHETIDSLKKQLETLVQAKKDYENELIAKVTLSQPPSCSLKCKLILVQYAAK